MKSFVWNGVVFELESKKYIGKNKDYVDIHFKAKSILYCLIRDYSGLVDCFIQGIIFEISRVKKKEDIFVCYRNLVLDKDIKSYRSYSISDKSLFLITTDYKKIEYLKLLG